VNVKASRFGFKAALCHSHALGPRVPARSSGTGEVAPSATHDEYAIAKAFLERRRSYLDRDRLDLQVVAQPVLAQLAAAREDGRRSGAS